MKLIRLNMRTSWKIKISRMKRKLMQASQDNRCQQKVTAKISRMRR